jgi:crotonobetainyl-CoA:carnitine CoA-transferase CaiB-like acyl-CoA transferase
MSTDERPLHQTAHERAAPMLPHRAGPLTDVRIIDLTQALAGPYATMILSDMGADVIKVEAPAGDTTRTIGPYTELDAEHAYGGYFASINRNKRSIVLDLKTPADKEILLRLIDTADVVIENYRAGIMDSLGLSYETLRARKPSLVYAAIRGFGDPRTGETPYTYWPSYDIVAQSMSGLVSYTGTKGGDRVASGPSVGDLYPATMMVVGVLGALHHARATGQGQFVDVGMADAVMALCESATWRYSYTGEVQQPRGTEHPSLCPFELYAAADGWIAIAAPGEGHWAELCRIIGRDDMIDHEDFRSSRRRVLNREAVRESVTAWTGNRTKQEVVDALAGRVPVGPVNDARDLFTSQHVQDRQMLVAVEHKGSGRPVLTPNTPVRYTETQGGVYRAAPRLGEDRDDILEELTRLEGDAT